MITDDHLIVREGLRLILETADTLEVVGEAVDGAECLRLVPELQPEVILMDLQMPRMDGITAMEHLRKDYPHLAIVILTTYNEDDLMIRGLQAGARGYLLKDSSRENLLDAIHAAAKGETLLKPEILARVLAPRPAPKPVALPPPLPTPPSPTASAKSCKPPPAASATKRSPTASASPSARSRRI
jgi:NarL family two-component system response regulator YdfI